MRDIEDGVQIIRAGTPHHTRGFIGGLYTRPFENLPSHEGHEHYIDHNMMLLCGSVRVDWKNVSKGTSGSVIVEGPRKLGELPTQIPVKAGAVHTVTKLEENSVWMCIFSEAEAEKLIDAEGLVPFNMERAHV